MRSPLSLHAGGRPDTSDVIAVSMPQAAARSRQSVALCARPAKIPFLLLGIKKVEGQLTLVCTAYNFKRLFRLVAACPKELATA
jgi:hypothetical protein